jgi:hypothetical protein
LRKIDLSEPLTCDDDEPSEERSEERKEVGRWVRVMDR